MKKLKDTKIIEDKLLSIGLDISLIESIVSFVELGITNELEVEKSDLENLVIVLKKMIKNISDEYDKLENFFNL